MRASAGPSARRWAITARELQERAEAAEAGAKGEAVNLGSVELLGVKVAGKRTRTEKDGRLMAFVTLSDETDTFELVIYPDDYARLARRLRGPGPFRVRGRAVAELGELLVTAKEIDTMAVAGRAAGRRTG